MYTRDDLLQAEGDIRSVEGSRGDGDVYKSRLCGLLLAAGGPCCLWGCSSAPIEAKTKNKGQGLGLCVGCCWAQVGRAVARVARQQRPQLKQKTTVKVWLFVWAVAGRRLAVPLLGSQKKRRTRFRFCIVYSTDAAGAGLHIRISVCG